MAFSRWNFDGFVVALSQWIENCFMILSFIFCTSSVSTHSVLMLALSWPYVSSMPPAVLSHPVS
jgi:hypothetical protein